MRAVWRELRQLAPAEQVDEKDGEGQDQQGLIRLPATRRPKPIAQNTTSRTIIQTMRDGIPGRKRALAPTGIAIIAKIEDRNSPSLRIYGSYGNWGSFGNLQ